MWMNGSAQGVQSVNINCSDTTDAFTVFGWYYRNASADANNMFVDKNNGGDFDIDLVGNYALTIDIDPTGGNDNCVVGQPTNDTWTHLAVVRNTSGTWIYENGRLEAACTDDQGSLNAWTSTPIRIGVDSVGAEDFIGGIDKWGFTCTDLRNDTIERIYNGSSGGLLRPDGNITLNFTMTSNDRANLSFNCDNTDAQASCCAQVSGSATWYCSNTSNILLTTGTNRTATLLLNSTNSSKTPIFKSVTLETWVGNVAPEAASLSYPTNNLVYNDTFRIEFNYTALDNNTADNLSCSLRINNVVNATNLSLSNGSLVSNFANFSVSSARYNWSVNCSDQQLETNSSVQFFNISNLRPSNVTGLSYSATSSTVILSWSASTDPDIAAYHVYRGTGSGGPYTDVGNTSNTSLTDTGLNAGATYFYVVSARDTGNNYGLNSTELSAQTVGGVGGAGASGGGSKQNITECLLYLKFPENRVSLFRSDTVGQELENEFSICNNNQVSVVHNFNLEGNVIDYCSLSESSKSVSGNSCYTGKLKCTTPEQLAKGRLILSREEYLDNVQKIPSCETSIIVETGKFKFSDFLRQEFGSSIIQLAVVVVSAIIIILVLVYQLLKG